MGIAENIKRLRTGADLTQAKLAEMVGVTRATVTQWETGWSQPRMGAVEKLASAFGVPLSAIVDDDSRPSLPKGAVAVRGSSAMVPVRVLGRTHAGAAMDEEECGLEMEVPRSVAEAHPGCFLLKVEGDCMDRRFPDGCMVLVDPRMEPRNGMAVVAEFEDGTSVLRCYLRGQSTVVLAADSHADHDDIVLTGEAPVRTVGVAVWFQSEKDERE